MQEEFANRPADGNQAAGDAQTSQGSTTPEQVFDVGGKAVPLTELIDKYQRYDPLQSEFTRRSQKLAEHGLLDGQGDAPTAQPAQENTQEDYSGYGQPGYTPEREPSYGGGGRGVEPSEAGPATVEDMLEALQEQYNELKFRVENPGITPQEQRQIDAARQQLERQYGTYIPIELAQSYLMVQSANRMAEEMSRQKRAEEATRQQQQAQSTPVMPGSGMPPSAQGPAPTSFEDLLERIVPQAGDEMGRRSTPM